MGFERADDVVGAYVDVVVAEDAEALRGVEGGEDLGGDACSTPGDLERQGPAADVVSSDEDQVRMERVHFSDHAFEKRGLRVLLEMKIAHLDDAEVYESIGKIANGEGAMGYLELMAGMRTGVGGETEAGDGKCSTEEAAAGYMMRLRMAARFGTLVHTP